MGGGGGVRVIAPISEGLEAFSDAYLQSVNNRMPHSILSSVRLI